MKPPHTPAGSRNSLRRTAITATCALIFAAGELPAGDNVAFVDPRSPTKLKQMLRITWRRGPDLPQGLQDSDGGIIGGQLISVGGFCSGGLKIDNQRKPGRYPRGFLKKGWRLDLADAQANWQPLPDFPGAARQGLSAAKVDQSLYFWGGFSYSEPYCYRDGFRLSGKGDNWQWEALPEFPWPVTTVATSVLGSKIYAFGGADYNAEAFFTANDRHGKTERLGARLSVIDTRDLSAGWKQLPPCPGTPRWVHAFAAVGDKLYVIGGATGNVSQDGKQYGYCTVVDNWMFDVATSQWMRLADLPISSGNFPRSSQIVFENRYLILPGGYQYAWVLGTDGRIGKPYGKATSTNPKTGLYHDVFVYDTQTGRFGSTNPMPLDNNLPMTVVSGDQIYLLGGETGGGYVEGEYYGHHPELLLIGTIEEMGGGEK
jgi:hypothetical protein